MEMFPQLKQMFTTCRELEMLLSKPVPFTLKTKFK